MNNKTAVELATVKFSGGELQAVKDKNGKVWVSVRRVCEQLGVSMQKQHFKLADSPWACITIQVIRDQSGRRQGLTMIDLDSLPMWLATIHAGKVKEEARPKLTEFQLHAKRALAEHFFGVVTRADLQSKIDRFMEAGKTIKCILAGERRQLSMGVTLRGRDQDFEPGDWMTVADFISRYSVTDKWGVCLSATEKRQAGKWLVAASRRLGALVTKKPNGKFPVVNCYRRDVLQMWATIAAAGAKIPELTKALTKTQA